MKTINTKPGASAFRKLREGAKLTQDQMAERLVDEGVDITTKSGVCRLEERGTDRRAIWRAYAKIFGVTVDSIEALDG